MTVQDSERVGPLFTQFVQSVGVARLTDEEAQHLRKFVSWCGLDIRIAAIYPHQLQSYLEQVTGSSADPKPCASALRTFFAYALKAGWVESNPATGLRITKRSTRSDPRAAAAQAGSTFISRKRFAELTVELEKHKGEGRERISRLLHAAIKDGDLRENAAYDEAKYQQGMMEARIRELEQTLRTSSITEDETQSAEAGAASATDAGIKIGMRVELELTGGSETIAYQLVGPSEVDPLEGRISYLSPVGASLLTKHAGDTVAVETPAGSETYRVLSYSF
jgi:transcription elongation factor GreA